MKKSIYSVLLLLLPFMSPVAFGQAGSVELKDGGGTLISSHASVTEAYSAIPVTLSQAYIIEIGSSYNGASETFPITFTQKTGASTANTITLRPAAGVSSALIQSSVSSNPIIQLNDADYIIIDGRAGGIGNSRNLSISNLATGSSANTINLVNGACFNEVKYCNILNATTGSAGRGISLGASASNTSGNSDNRFSYCFFPSGRYRFNSSGTTANPNTRNTLYGCIFENIKFVGIWGQSGTGRLLIDSCSIYCNTGSGDGAYGILFDTQRDTAIIRNNNIYDLQNGSGSSIRGIQIRSVASDNFSDIYNNFISVSTGTPSLTSMAGIEYSGSIAINARIRYNTIRIGGTLSSSGTSGNVGSAALLKSASPSTSQFDIRNNIFVNDRSGGTTGLQHLAMAVTGNNDVMNIDYNTYSSASGNLVRLGSVVYTSFATYAAAAAPGTEQNSNDFGVQLVSASDLHLSGASLGNGSLAAVPMADISTDIDGQTRNSIPYRGADEASPALTPGCSGTPDPGMAVTSTPAVCSGDNISVTLSGLNPLAVPVLSFQWQSSTDGITYSNIAGATAISYSSTISQDTWFRCEVTCNTSGDADTSAAVQVSITPVPSVSSISETHNTGQYTFTPNGVTGSPVYAWNFGDGGTSALANPTHNYTAVGNYNVTLVVSNACGSDTATLAITVGCEGVPDGGTATATATTVCPGQNITLNLAGINALIAPTLSFQWQSSPDGNTYTNIAGATSVSYNVTPLAQTYYRCVVTCNASGQSNNSTAVTVNYTPGAIVSGITETHTGGTYSFTATGLANAASVFWNFGNGATSNVPSPVYTYPVGGTYTVTVIAVNSCGSDTASIVLNVGCTGAPAMATLSPVSDTVCLGQNISISLGGIDTTEAYFYTYQWQWSTDGINFSDIPGGTLSTLSVAAGSQDHFRCIVTCATTGQSTQSQTIAITILPLPGAGGSISETHNGADYTFGVNGISGNFDYAWDFGDGNTGSGASVQHTYTANGTYTVTVVISNECGSQTLTRNINQNTGLEENALAMGLHLYPNPSDDQVQIVSEQSFQADRIRISDISGRTLHIWNTPVQLPFSFSARALGLQSGIYLAEITAGTQTGVLRFIVR